MKKLLLTASILITLCSHAQTRTGNYVKVTTDHFTPSKQITQSTRCIYTSGSLKVGKQLILIDSAGKKPQAYTIIHKDPIEIIDEGFWLVRCIVAEPYKDGLKCLTIDLLMDKDKTTILEVIIKKSKATTVTYSYTVNQL